MDEAEKTLGIACDAYSDEYKQEILRSMSMRGYKIIDLNKFTGLSDADAVGVACAAAVSALCPLGVLLVSSSGNGLQMVANKFPHVRAAPCHSIEDVNEAIHEFNANMCEVSTILPPFHGTTILSEFVRLKLQCGESV